MYGSYLYEGVLWRLLTNTPRQAIKSELTLCVVDVASWSWVSVNFDFILDSLSIPTYLCEIHVAVDQAKYVVDEGC